MKKILTEAAQIGDATVRTIMYRWRKPEGHYSISTWRLEFIGGYKFEENGARPLDAYSGFFYANGFKPAMDTKKVGLGRSTWHRSSTPKAIRFTAERTTGYTYRLTSQ